MRRRSSVRMPMPSSSISMRAVWSGASCTVRTRTRPRTGCPSACARSRIAAIALSSMFVSTRLIWSTSKSTVGNSGSSSVASWIPSTPL